MTNSEVKPKEQFYKAVEQTRRKEWQLSRYNTMLSAEETPQITNSITGTSKKE